MTDREFRIIRGHGRWVAQLRFFGTDDALRYRGILPGWRGFQSSVDRSVVEAAINDAKAELEATIERSNLPPIGPLARR